jgi:putative phosphoribosyl transferase
MDTVMVPTVDAEMPGDLTVPAGAAGVVLFAHGSGSSRHSPRNRAVAAHLGAAGFGTLLLDLFTAEEDLIDARTAELRFDIDLLTNRLIGAIDWLAAGPGRDLPLGLFGASTGAAGALAAAVDRPGPVRAVVSRGGRPDLAAGALDRVAVPVLLIVGGRDTTVLELNRRAAARLTAPHEVSVVPGATHLFEEPGALDRVAELAAAWFERHL